jgi:hypothetical protein
MSTIGKQLCAELSRNVIIPKAMSL